ncbi:MAG: hypothetical protein WBF17_25120, partial [Phycisphaerae bacterium]
MKTSKNIRCISLILLFLTVKVGAGFAAEKPGALVLAWNDANATMAALRGAGLEVTQAPRLSPPPAEPIELGNARLVVVSAD